MSAEQPANKVYVLFDCDDPAKNQFLELPETLTLREVKEQRAPILGIESQKLELLDESGGVFNETLSLSSLIQDGSPMIKIREKLKKIVKLFIGLYESTEAIQSVETSLNVLPQCLHVEIYSKFNIHEDTSFRLVSVFGEPLRYDVTLAEQGVEDERFLLIDPGYEIRITDIWGVESEIRTLWQSSNADELYPSLGFRMRLLHEKDQKVQIFNYVEHAIMSVGISDITQPPQCLQLTLEPLFYAAVMTQLGVEEKSFWPSERVGRVFTKSKHIYFENEPLSRSCHMMDADLPDNALLHTRSTGITVRLPCGKRSRVLVPRQGTLGDLRQRLGDKLKDDTSNVELYYRHRILSDDEKIEEIGKSTEIKVLPSCVRKICVKLGRRIVTVKTEGSDITFSILITKLCRQTNILYHVLQRKTFQCRGCGRRICKKYESYQRIPCHCCQIQSLQLTEILKKRSREDGTQGAISRRQLRLTSSQFRSKSKEVMTNQPPVSRSSEPIGFLGYQSAFAKSSVSDETPTSMSTTFLSLSQSYEPPLTSSSKNQPGSKWDARTVAESPLESFKSWTTTANISQVEELLEILVCELRSREPGKVKSTTGDRCDASFQTDASKNLFQSQHPPVFLNPEQPIFIISGAGYEGNGNFKCTLNLVQPASVFQLRQALADRMGWDLDKVRLMRWLGESRAGVPLVRVCDERDQSSWEFGDNTGCCYKNKDVSQRYSRWLDDDDEPVMFVPHRRCIFTVYKK